jgi:hypothetical protein
MFKIDAPGATGSNEFTEGNPSLGVPATQVSDDWLNAVQREMVYVIETLAGITLNKLDDNQLGQAILQLLTDGGTQLNQSVLNNVGATTITNLIFDKSTIKGGKFDFEIERRTDTQNVQEIGTGYVTHDTADDTWRISWTSNLDDAGVTFSVTGTGQVQYASDDLTGASYVGAIRVANIVKFKQ